MPKYSIVIPTYNRIADLRQCLESIQSNTILSTVEIIVVCNGCQDGSKEYVETLGEPFRVIYWPEPLGYTKATNIGIILSRGEYIVLFNNDNVLLDWAKDNNWLNLLERPFMEHATAGFSGPHKQWRGGYPWLLFYCTMIKREVFSIVGMLDETFNPGAGEDTDICIKAQKLGFTVHQVPKEEKESLYTTEFPIWHKGSLTMIDIPNHAEHYKRNEEILRARYGVGTLKEPENG